MSLSVLHTLAAGLLAWAACAGASASPVRIRVGGMAVACEPATGALTVTVAGSGLPAVTGALAAGGGTASTVRCADAVFGAGQAIELRGANGLRTRIALFPHLPFALITTTVPAGDSVNQVPVFSGSVRSGGELVTLGTGGLLRPDANPGSYEWLAVAEPRTRAGLVCAWLTHDRATGVVDSGARDGAVTLAARSEYGGVRVAPGTELPGETLAVGIFPDARLGLEAWADAVARQYHIKLPPQPAGYCTWYAEQHGGSSDETHLAALGAFAAEKLLPYGFTFVQIDDGWQDGDPQGNGPRKNFTRVREGGPYTHGMKPVADSLKARGMTAGLWFMPFAGTHNDPWYADKQDWFIKHRDGTPYDTAWGGTCIDMTNPTAREYLRAEVARIARDWGYGYFKMDGLYTGLGVPQTYVNTGYKADGFGDAVRHDPAVSAVEAFRLGFRTIREAAGPGVFFLGCCNPQNMRSYGATFGMVDAMRIGPDNSGSWAAWLGTSPVFGSRHYFLNGRVWYNDPDPVYVRASIPLTDARTLCSWAAVTGCLFSESDWLPGLPEERLEILRRTARPHGCAARPVDLFRSPVPRVWRVTDSRVKPARELVALFNWGDAPATVATDRAELGLDGKAAYAVWDYWNGRGYASLEEALAQTIPAHGCAILAVRARANRPQALSTNAHVTQGMADILEEGWHAGKLTLEGKSRVVAGDPYTIRCVAPAGYSLAGAEAGPRDRAVIEPAAGPFSAATFTPAADGVVTWRLTFRKR